MSPWPGWADWTPPDTKENTGGQREQRNAAASAGQADAPSGPVPDVASRGKSPTQPKGLLRGDRGTRRGARRVIVTEDRQVVDHQLAKGTGTKGVFFQSRREALAWVARLEQQDRGQIRGLRRQVKFALQAKRPDGLLETVTSYTADFVFEEPTGIEAHPWTTVVEDVKPRGGLREDTYILKRKWFEVQYGQPIRETH